MIRSVSILGALMALVVSALCASITVGWDASTNLDVVGYHVYASTNQITTNSIASSPIKVDAGTNLQASVSGLTTGLWYLSCTCYTTNMESDPADNILIDCPAPPARMKTVVVQYGGTVTNFTDVGFFRLRIDPQQ